VLAPFGAVPADLWHKVTTWFLRIWSELRPGPETKAGVLWGCAIPALAAAIVAAAYLNTGFGLWADALVVIAGAAVLLLASLILVPLLLTVARALPRKVTALVVGCTLIVMLALLPVGLLLGPLACLSGGVLGATIATWRSGVLHGAPRKKIAATAILGVLGLVGVAAILWLMVSEPADKPQARAEGPLATPLRAANPGEPGPYRVRKLTYGTKDHNPRRPEYNRPDVSAPTVNASRFFQDFKGWRRNLRRRYWGFGMDQLPLNAIVWKPDAPGRFPLVLIVHGNHDMADFSDPGYEYLGELLASRGFVLASIDENFLNSGLFHDPPKQQAVRGWMLLEHLKLWREWSRDPDHPLGSGADLGRIALMGHSRGGEAVATAALFNRLTHYPDDGAIRFDYGFPIRSLVAIAPVDGQYRPSAQNRTLEDVNYFTIHGSNDADVSSFMGSAQWERIRYPRGGDWFKAELYIARANHGQFNTSWGRSDAGYPTGWFLHLKPLLDPEQQRRIAKVSIAAFLEATLNGKPEYRDFFRNPHSASGWLADTVYVNRYQDASYRLLANFNEDVDLTTGAAGTRLEGADLSIWREGRIPYRRGERPYNGLFLAWNVEHEEDANLKPQFTVTLPPDWQLRPGERLELSVALVDEDAPRLKQETEKMKEERKPESQKKEKDRPSPDFTIELLTAGGGAVARPLSQFGRIPPPMKTRFAKIGLIDSLVYKKPAEPVFQNITVPLAAFEGVDPSQVRAVRLRFDRTKSAVLVWSGIGFD
jgi:dienelactone hydrolase